MPMMRVAPDCEIFYRIDDFTDPWTKPETVLLWHGVADSGDAWYAWVPHLARHYRVLRPDIRGFGRSTPMPRDHAWSFDRIGQDISTLTERLGIESFHLVAAKVGGMMALHFAAHHPTRLRSLTVLGTPILGRSVNDAGYSAQEIETKGVEHWARRTMAGRLGTHLPAEAHEWWAKLMGATPATTQAGMLAFLPTVDIRPELPRITCPTLVVTTGAPDNPAQNITDTAQVAAWQQRIPNSELLVIPSDSFHVAASDADVAAQETLAFIRRQGRDTRP
jgi:pimeloyl-ACP methyl ester carboxylesterase